MRKIKLGIVGVTGLVGQTILKIIEEKNILFNELRLFASKRSENLAIRFQDVEYRIKSLKEGCFEGLEYVLFASSEEVAKEYIPLALKAHATVIDNSSFYRLKEDVPLIVPEINGQEINKGVHSLIASPNCCTIQCVVPLSVLRKYDIRRITYTTFQSVSGCGNNGIRDLLRCRSGKEPYFFPLDIACTCIPLVGSLNKDGFSTEERKMEQETKKILNLQSCKISATCVRVPVMFGHGVSVSVEFNQPYKMEQVIDELKVTKGLVVCEDGLPSSLLATRTDNIYVGRIRRDESVENGLLFYCVADNVRKGAASNVISILSHLI